MNGQFYIATLLLLVLGITPGLAQTPRAYEQAAAAAFEVKDYYAAFKYYGRVLEMEPARTDISVLYADAARMYGAYQDAEKHYEVALTSDNAAGGKYHQALFGLAVVKKHLGKYSEALKLFERYATRPDSDPDLRSQANVEIADCEWAMEKITNPDPLVELNPFDTEFNTGDSEMGMVVIGDTVYYSALRTVEWGDKHFPARPLLQVMMSIGGKKPVVADFNVEKKHTGLPAFSPDRKCMIVPLGDYSNETDVQCKLYFSTIDPQTGKWATFKPLPDQINQPNSTSTQPFIVENEGYYTLYYISDAAGGQGGKDIWATRFSSTGSFANPYNLSSINTAGDEVTPYFEKSSKILFFSSTGYQSLGGFDIYKSKLDKNGKWGNVKHLPVPLNSSYNDLYFTPPQNAVGYLTTNRIGAVAGEESCCYDLYRTHYLPLNLQAQAFSTDTKEPLDEVFFVFQPEGEAVRSKFSGPNVNKADFKVEREHRYSVVASKEGYFPDSASVSLVDLETYTSKFTEKLYLTPMPVQLAVKVYNQFTKEPITGVKVFLYERSGKMREEKNTGATQNESDLNAAYRQGYVIVAQKDGYAADTVLVNAAELSQPGTKLLKNLYLTPSSLYGLLPLAIYFDNNMPPRAPTIGGESYERMYAAYMQRRAEYIETFTQNITNAEEKLEAISKLNQFFDNDVQGGMTKLEYFTEHLDVFLQGGYAVEIMVKGFASPLASKEYNLALTRRRIASVQNYLRSAKGGVYESFIQQKQLLVSTAPLGEDMAQPNVSDSSKQLQQSVFSVDASRERRAEIIEIRLKRNEK